MKRGKKPNDEIAEDSMTANKKKAAFKRKYQGSYLNYGFIAIGDSHSPSPLCLIGDDWQAIKCSKLLHYMETTHPALKDIFGVFQKKKTHEQKNISNYQRSPLHQMCLH